MNHLLELLSKIVYTFLIFVLIPSIVNGQIVITEIMYNPPESGMDSLEYIELFNNSDIEIDLNGYSFDRGVVYEFDDFLLDAGQFVVIAVDSVVMMNVLGVEAFQWKKGGLRNSGEIISLSDSQGLVIDSVNYGNNAPWPKSPNGHGFSLELCDPSSDNALPQNWKPSASSRGISINNVPLFASPGASNLVSCADYRIIISNFNFDPSELTIRTGETVEWKNVDGFHNVNGSLTNYPNNPQGFFSGDPERAEWSYFYTFNINGDYDYQCDVHVNNGMKGIIHVVDDIIPKLAITEIMYNSPDDTDSLEYIEFKNQGITDIAMNGINVTGDIEYKFKDWSLKPGNFVVIALDSNAVEKTYRTRALNWTSGNLKNSTGTIILESPLGGIIDQITYSDKGEWRVEADGDGRSLVLCDDSGSNDSPADWGVSGTITGITIANRSLYGSPGIPNTCDTTTIVAPSYAIHVVTTVDSLGVPDSINVKCRLQGLVYGVDLQVDDKLQFSLIDSTGGIGVFALQSNGYVVQEGDEIEVTGVIGHFNGLTQIAMNEINVISRNNELSAPKIVDDLNEETESEFIMLRGMKFVDPSKWQGSGRWFTIKITDGSNEFTMYIDDAVDLANMQIPTTNSFAVIGLGGQFDRSVPYTSGYQIIPRSAKDIIPLTGVEDSELNPDVFVFPNPVLDEINVKSKQQVKYIELYNSEGVLMQKSHNEIISLLDYPKGIYVLIIQLDRGDVIVRRIIKL